MFLNVFKKTACFEGCAFKLEKEGVMKAAIEIPSAKCTMFSTGIFCSRNNDVNADSIIPPSPKPSNPLINPTKKTNNKNNRTHSVAIV